MKNGSHTLNDIKPIVGIIGGTSQFGNWFKFFFESQGLKVLIASRKTKLTPIELAKIADIVIVSVPISATLKIIKTIRGYIKKSSLLCDFTSLKELPMREMLKAKCGVTGMHPLFGHLVLNIKNQTIIFCSGRDNKWTKFLKNIFKQNGAKVIFTTPRNHDKKMAIIQALTHFINIAFAQTIQKQDDMHYINSYLTPVFRLQALNIGRVLGANPELYTELEMGNPRFKKVLKDFLEIVVKLSTYIKEKNKNNFIKDFQKSADFIKNFIPIAQIKATEIISLLDQQPIELKKIKNISKFGKNGVAYLGPEGTFSHQAALNIFSSQAKTVACPTISKIFEIVMNEEIALGVVPAENSTEGLVQETLDNLIKYPLNIIGSYTLPIHLCLLGRTDNINDIKIIKSHFQPIAQSRNWLNKNFPTVKLETEPSSVSAILSIIDPSVAFIASEMVAKKYNLKILAKNIEDKKGNATQFYIISKNIKPILSKKLGSQKSFILLSVCDRVGALRDILSCFCDQKLNLLKLHSKISEAEEWKYYFFMEVDSSPDSKKLQSVLKDIKQYCLVVRLLGAT